VQLAVDPVEYVQFTNSVNACVEGTVRVR